ncbi:hypothetical protein FQN54_006608 [Arachnomyces sp. PD_36]|nr:hypothetical protein FQN54_006608 [Arachnomyces sp. PD_36]
MGQATTLTSLPEDILVLLFPYLKPQDFLSLCSINSDFYRNFYQSPEYWRERTASTFRIPIQPMLRADGTRWHWLYKNLRTRTQIYAWGSAHASRDESGVSKEMRRSKITWPKKMVELGPVADLQFGGWSTTLLTSDGVLHSVGNLNETRSLTSTMLQPLKFPETDDCSDEATTIRQFSSGRCQVLGLSDDGRIWSWEIDGAPGVCISFTNVHISLGLPSVNRPGAVSKVIAGWNRASAYIVGAGIVYWKPMRVHREEGEDLIDCTLVPGTDFRRACAPRDIDESQIFGEVQNYVVLEAYIVFITDLNKVYAFKMGEPSAQFSKEDVVELTTFSAPGREIKDIHGSFRKFAILTLSGEVLVGNEGLINTFYNSRSQDNPEPPTPYKPGPLQHTNVVSLAFGDHHFHALHAHGKISSHGVESGGSGSFGFGGEHGGPNFRGVRYVDTRRPFQDNTLAPYAQEKPHYIWFEPEKRHWLANLEAKSKQGQNLSWNSVFRSGHSDISKYYNECIEREGEAWGDFPDLEHKKDYGLDAYFALNVAAGGWKSGALVLVNQELADEISSRHTVLVEEKDGEKPRTIIGEPSFPGENPSPQGTRQVERYKWELQEFPTLETNDPLQVHAETYNWFRDWKYGMPPAQA